MLYLAHTHLLKSHGTTSAGNKYFDNFQTGPEHYKYFMFDSDLNIFYCGGSGGFYFLHCLLLNKQHFCFFPRQIDILPHPALRLNQQDYDNIRDPSWPGYDKYLTLGNAGNPELISAELQWAHNPEIVPGWFDQQFDTVHFQNWNIDTQSWKSTEIWPENERTLTSFCPYRNYKIFYTCNDIDQWLTLPGKKIVLYTDIRTQLRLAMHKKAWVYVRNQTMSTSTKNKIRNSKIYKQCLVDTTVHDALLQADESVKLQEFVKLMLSNTANQQQQNFTQKWLNYHTPDLRRRSQLG